MEGCTCGYLSDLEGCQLMNMCYQQDGCAYCQSCHAATVGCNASLFHTIQMMTATHDLELRARRVTLNLLTTAMPLLLNAVARVMEDMDVFRKTTATVHITHHPVLVCKIGYKILLNNMC